MHGSYKNVQRRAHGSAGLGAGAQKTLNIQSTDNYKQPDNVVITALCPVLFARPATAGRAGASHFSMGTTTIAWRGLQQLLSIVVEQSDIINMSLNARKSVCMVFSPSDRSKVVMSCFPEFSASGEKLQYVQGFKYLGRGHIISSNNNDDADIQREITNMFIRTNILARKFYKCTAAVKTVLFRSYCICLYDAALWTNFKVGMLNKLRSCYNRCIKSFLVIAAVIVSQVFYTVSQKNKTPNSCP